MLAAIAQISRKNGGQSRLRRQGATEIVRRQALFADMYLQPLCLVQRVLDGVRTGPELGQAEDKGEEQVAHGVHVWF